MTAGRACWWATRCSSTSARTRPCRACLASRRPDRSPILRRWNSTTCRPICSCSGGYVGLELAQAYRRFGSRVTVIQHGPQLMGREDPDVAAEVQRLLSDAGIHVRVAAETLQVHG